jgi:hypothetical protein
MKITIYRPPNSLRANRRTQEIPHFLRNPAVHRRVAGFPKWFLPLGFPTKIFHEFLIRSSHATCPAHLILGLITLITCKHLVTVVLMHTVGLMTVA